MSQGRVYYVSGEQDVFGTKGFGRAVVAFLIFCGKRCGVRGILLLADGSTSGTLRMALRAARPKGSSGEPAVICMSSSAPAVRDGGGGL
jgi:hypothetical protein